ncbi:transcriptional regulator, TetR family [Nocardia nova SH22a]|uniref:Transcriptional regulator, TetR family n=1 Tax=Nocardia nova SH22a TaxID=1415166 RepID=W5TS11_9NOCA|nr:TetR/AcrR family transcriptional regulator [Nocardia nova]AHH20006.1 transcriptional regulator, TetR family [Nocardia nova SH22a]
MARLTVQQRREQLLEAAARVIARDGLADTTTRAITDEAGMARGSFHYCFESKDQLLEHLVRKHVKDMVAIACAAWDDRAALADNLSEGMKAILQFGGANKSEEIFTYELIVYALRSSTSSTSARLQYEDYRVQAQAYLDFVAERAGLEWVVPAQTLARMFATFIDGSMLCWLADEDLAAADAALEGFAGMLAGTSRSQAVIHGPGRNSTTRPESTSELEEVRDENARLRKLLVDAELEKAALRAFMTEDR